MRWRLRLRSDIRRVTRGSGWRAVTSDYLDRRIRYRQKAYQVSQFRNQHRGSINKLNTTDGDTSCDQLPDTPRKPKRTKGPMKRTLLALACLSAVSIAAMAADDKTKPDNTATNERDRSGETQTSGDQSNSPADLKTRRLSGRR
jgi:hypothetical protein